MGFHVPGLRMATKAQDGFDTGQFRQDTAPPMARAFPAGRKVGAVAIIAREAEAHGKESEFGWIVELVATDAEPGPQPVTRGIVERETRSMGTQSRRLADDEKLGLGRNLQNRAWRMGQRRSYRMVETEAAAAHFVSNVSSTGTILVSR